ncbi:anaerobic ribonucleoside-triphosphate reductase activating protein [Candidatus Thorarchaeota archaeon]|nr:MAG: anaerobic ribonucleoside-triphosphate reductase activating protein [Candidatus Thorarchaeota archaeon]
MRIASIIDVSLVDVPGIPVTVIFTAGCNFDCPYCQNANIIPLNSGMEMSVSEVLSGASGHLVDGYCVTGGEPTIQKELPDLLKALSKKGDFHINLNSQGSVPSVLEECIPYLDSVWLDLKASPTRYEKVCRTKHSPWPNVKKSIDLLLKSNVDLWPRTTYAGNLLSPQDIVDIIDILEELGFEGRYVVQDYVPSSGVRESEATNLTRPKKEDLEEIIDEASGGVEVDLQFR